MRLRPRLSHERKDEADLTCVKIELPNRVVLLDPQDRSAYGRAFDCDFVFDSSDPYSDQFADQKAVYDAIGVQIVDSAVQGYNACLCAYGQTGTGKTHTVVGDWRDPEGRGLLPRLCAGLFAAIGDLRSGGAEVKVQASYIELYNNKLRDLLSSASATPATIQRAESKTPRSTSPMPSPRPRTAPAPREEQHLKIHTHPAVGVYVENLSEHSVNRFEDMGRLVGIGERARQTAETSMNKKSSRSHTVFSLKVEVNNTPIDGGHRMATMQVVDLAGRENEQDSECTGDRFRELTFINRSLFQLANCVNALSTGDGKHVPFRNSKLTLLLSESFQRNSRTCLLATLTPSSQAYEENLLTCRFLESTGRITTQPVANRFSTQDLRAKLQDELEQMRRSLGLEQFGKGRRAEPDDPLFKLHEALLRQVSRGLTEGKDGNAANVRTRADLKQAILADACAQAGRCLNSVQTGLEKLEEANSTAAASLGKAETQLSKVEAIVDQVRPRMRNGHQRSRDRGNPKVSVLVEPLPPIVQISAEAKQEAREARGEPTVTFSVSLPPIIMI